jgi:hypothetical protein
MKLPMGQAVQSAALLTVDPCWAYLPLGHRQQKLLKAAIPEQTLCPDAQAMPSCPCWPTWHWYCERCDWLVHWVKLTVTLLALSQ